MPGVEPRWRKSSYSETNGGNCVEAAGHNGTVLVRDIKQHGGGQIHRFTAVEWRAFVAAVKTAR